MTFFRKRPLYSASPITKRESEARWRVLPFLGRLVKRLAMGIGFFILLSLVYVIVVASVFQKNVAAPTLPEKVVLYLKIDQPIVEIQQQVGFANPFEPLPPTLRQITDAIDEGARDPRVKGLYVRLAQGSFSVSQAEEIRAAVKRFRAEDKFTKIYSSSYGGGLGGLVRMYLASAFEERWMQPMGVVSMAGLRAEVPFFRGVLDKIGVTPHFFQRKEYKTAYESITANEMSDANRESLTDVVHSIRDAMIAGIPKDLGMSTAEFEGLVDLGLFTAAQSLDEGLITHSDYVDVLIDQIRTDLLGAPDTDDLLFVTFDAYMADIDERVHAKAKPVVALIYAVGAIMDTQSGRGAVAAADEIAPSILDAADNDNVEAIILRIDSPGGSPVASESILRAVQKAQSKGKPVIVSMGSVAASGGYWIAAGADKIFAMPTTLTGSIGVVGGKFSFEGVSEKVGVEWDRSIQWGDNAGIWSFNEGFTEGQAERIDVMLDGVYDSFLERVAVGRGMTIEQADTIARGRVWPGVLAMNNGLVDEMGGLQDATDYTARLLGFESRRDINLVQMPLPLSPFEQILDMFSEQGMVMEGLRLQGQLSQMIMPMMQEMIMMQDHNVLTYEPMQVR